MGAIMIYRWTVGLAFLMLAGSVWAQGETGAGGEIGAQAELRNISGDAVGTATFIQTDAGVEVSVEVEGFTGTDSVHGIHIHETGLCSPDFGAAGAHFNPAGLEHGAENPHGVHAGDLPNITIGGAGNASYSALATGFTLGDEVGRSVLAGDGSALMIHQDTDDLYTDPDGNSGGRIACGVIEAVASAPTMTESREGQVFSAQSNTLIPAAERPTEELMAALEVPEGFSVEVFADNLGNARIMAQSEDGTVYLTRREEQDVMALVDEDGDGAADTMRSVAEGLPYVNGITIHEGMVYLATDTSVYRAPIEASGDFGVMEVLIADLPDAGQHPNRTLAVGPDGMLYITVGSTCNVCEDTNPENATILRANLDGSEREIFASGLRNTIGFGWHPETGVLYGMDHGSDNHGDDTPPEELNRLELGNDYGWPFCYGNRQVDNYFSMTPTGATGPEVCAQTQAPVLTYQAHSAPIGWVYYSGSAFPEDYRNDAFIAMRGSWNRDPAVGYKVVRLHFENGEPAAFEDFLSGFLLPGGVTQFGRPAGLLVAQDGSLLVADDTGGVIYRVAYTGD